MQVHCRAKLRQQMPELRASVFTCSEAYRRCPVLGNAHIFITLLYFAPTNPLLQIHANTETKRSRIHELRKFEIRSERSTPVALRILERLGKYRPGGL